MAENPTLRADARRNRERVFAAAKDVFAEQGVATSMEEIARRASVGVGTLYRGFGDRAGLVEALYADEVGRLETRASQLTAELEPWEALATWVHDYVAALTSKRTMLMELMPLFQQRPEVLERSRRKAVETLEALLQVARAAGQVRPDLEATDLVRLVNGVLSPTEGGSGRTGFLLSIVLDGIRRRESDR